MRSFPKRMWQEPAKAPLELHSSSPTSPGSSSWSPLSPQELDEDPPLAPPEVDGMHLEMQEALERAKAEAKHLQAQNIELKQKLEAQADAEKDVRTKLQARLLELEDEKEELQRNLQARAKEKQVEQTEQKETVTKLEAEKAELHHKLEAEEKARKDTEDMLKKAEEKGKRAIEQLQGELRDLKKLQEEAEAIKAKKEAEEKAKTAAEENAKGETGKPKNKEEEDAKRETEENAKNEAEEKAKRDSEETANKEESKNFVSWTTARGNVVSLKLKDGSLDLHKNGDILLAKAISFHVDAQRQWRTDSVEDYQLGGFKDDEDVESLKASVARLFDEAKKTKPKEVLEAEYEELRRRWLETVQRNGRALQYAPEELKGDRELVLAAVENDVTAFGFASEKLQTELLADKEFAQELRKRWLETVQEYGRALENAPEELKGDKELVLAAVENDVRAFGFASEKLQTEMLADKEFAQELRRRWLETVQQNGLTLQDVPEQLKGDRELVLAAVENDVRAFGFASEKLQTEIRADKEFEQELRRRWLETVKEFGRALQDVPEQLKGDRELVLAAVQSNGMALHFATEELKGDKDFVHTAVRCNGRALESASAELRRDRGFVLELVRATQGQFLVEWAAEELRADDAFREECREASGSGLVFTWYDSYRLFHEMRSAFPTTGASIPGGEAYEKVMDKLNDPSRKGSSATVWFGDTPVWGFQADTKKWLHPPTECGRDNVPVPPIDQQDSKWRSQVESRVGNETPQVGSQHPCWCCRWIQEVRKQQAQGKIICCAVSNIFKSSWVREYGAGSSELSDARAVEFGLEKEWFKNGRPGNWGEGEIAIPGDGTFSRVAPVHPRTQKPLGEGCRWERKTLDDMGFPVYAFFMP